MKNKLLIPIIIMSVLILFSSCGKENKVVESQGKDTSTTKKNINQTEIAETSEVVDTTNESGETVTNPDGTKATTVVSVNKSVFKEEAKEMTEQKVPESNTIDTKRTNTTTKKVSSTTRNQNTTAKVPTTAKTPVTTKAPVTTIQAPTTTVASNPYGYKNAWNTLERMEADCKTYAVSKGYSYCSKSTLNTGHWTAPGTSSYGFDSPNSFKAKIYEGIDFMCSDFYKNAGYHSVRAVFLTNKNYKDYVSSDWYDYFANSLVQDDKIMVIFVVS